MPGRAREAFEQHHETAGLEPPPRGGLAGYAEEVVAQAPTLRARCGEADDEKLHALTEMQAAAAGLQAYIEGEQARPSRSMRGAARAANTTPASPSQTPPATRLAARATTRRAAMRSRR